MERLAHVELIFRTVLFLIIPSLIIFPFVLIRDVFLNCLCGRRSVADPKVRHPTDDSADKADTESLVPPSQAGSEMVPNIRAAKQVIVSASVAAGTTVANGGAKPRYANEYPPWVTAAADPNHMWGIPRRIITSSVGTFSYLVTNVFNRTKVYNGDALKEAVENRPAGTPLITISNHMSTLDDPLMWGLGNVRISDPRLCRWTLTAKDICFTNPFFSWIFRAGKSIPIDRWGSIFQDCIYEALDRSNEGDWVHWFPEGKVQQEHLPIKRMKWGVASVIARCSVPPIVLCIGHSGYEQVMPEKHYFGKRAIAPLWGKKIRIVIGQPIHFDIPALQREAEKAVASGDPNFGSDALVPLTPSGSIAPYPPYVGPPKTEEEEAEALREKKVKVDAVGDEATRRLYAEITRRLHDDLETLVFQAHAYTKE
eukprot:TRINITY_DN3122_c0_g1_i1.p1 TRINITY_DN3122_c0_g1~~TRINITY_DN3122_c0_g1_i1.p1  ORF type:complete len:425 (+),score=41.89 TRINITY_DN3122_c0_g1_i1:205-1479(+)